MAVRFAVFIARTDGGLHWLDPYHGEEHGYRAFFAGVDALVIGRGKGSPLFASGLPQIPLHLVESKSYPSGLVQIRYERSTSRTPETWASSRSP